MITTTKRGIVRSAAAIVLAAAAIGGIATAHAAGPNNQDEARQDSGKGGERNTALADAFNGVDRNTNWQQTSKLKLNFPTYHTEGIAYSRTTSSSRPFRSSNRP